MMLVLSRKVGESLVIADIVTVTVVEIRGAKVRLGIQAPEDVLVHRQEVYNRIAAEGALPGQQTLPGMGS
jgi:carbon storage regulator